MAKKGWIESEKRFVNPYVFINIDENCIKKYYECYEKESHGKNVELTGYIECEIETKTPIFIPNTTEENAFYETVKKHNEKFEKIKSYDFFSYDDIEGDVRENKYSKPVIPGSELRGVIRSAYEAAFNCCMSSVDLDRALYKRTTSPKNPGFLIKRNGKWFIEPAERIMLKVKDCGGDKFDKVNIDDYKEGETVYIEIDNKGYVKKIKDISIYMKTVKKISKTKFEGSVEGFIHKGENFSRKHHESVFINKSGKIINVDKNDIERLEKVMRLYRDNTININLNKDEHDSKGKKTWFTEFKINRGEGEKTLIYYSDDGKYLSPSCITKEIFKSSIRSILNDQGNHIPCSKFNNICEGCYLFGMVGDSNEDSFSGKIRFSDALPPKENDYLGYYEELTGLEELSSPKISATEFYMRKPVGTEEKGTLWNYDYYMDRKKGRNHKEYIKPKIRGRKFYWHSRRLGKTEIDKVSERSCVVRPVKSGKEFTFRVYFNDLPKDMLTKLIWVMSINNDGANCHKIGRGKPIGFGSISIKVTKINTRQINIKRDNIEYNDKVDLPYSKLDFSIIDKDKKSTKEFLKVTDFDNKPYNVSYPKVEGNDTIYQWFGANKEYQSIYTKPTISSTNQAINKALPDILDEDVSLPMYTYDKIKSIPNKHESRKNHYFTGSNQKNQGKQKGQEKNFSEKTQYNSDFAKQLENWKEKNK